MLASQATSTKDKTTQAEANLHKLKTLVNFFRMNKQYRKLGEILIEHALASKEQINECLKLQAKTRQPLGKILVSKGIISELALAEVLAQQKNLELINLSQYPVNQQAVHLISERFAASSQVIPIDFRDDKLVLAMANPLDIHTIDSVTISTGYKVIPVVATASEIQQAINFYLPDSLELKEIAAKLPQKSEAQEVEILEVKEDEPIPIIKLANNILMKAIRTSASDIHITSDENSVKVRYRIDGVLSRAWQMPLGSRKALISRLKIISGMDIAENRLPQDGRFTLKVNGQQYEFRAVALPTVQGEDMFIRILPPNRFVALEELGLEPALLNAYQHILNKSSGGILVTGPTGSGKTTTVYASMNTLNQPGVQMVSIEDPVELQIPGVSQLQVNNKAGLTFASGLRAILRSDPDVIMVGEIRDLETAEIAIRAALTGHLFLSTLHTRDSTSALTRLIDMGIDAFLVASAISCILAQRLVRRLCPHCKKEMTDKSIVLNELEKHNLSLTSIRVYKAIGCPQCYNTGYKGRIGLFEMLVMDEEISKACLSLRSATDIRRIALKKGMQTLYQDGLKKVAAGITTLTEVKSVAS